MNLEQLFDYLDNIIKPALEEYAKKRNMEVDKLLLEVITLESTGLFNYRGRQSAVYNRLHNNNITNLKELFILYDSNNLDYGKNELKSNNNYYIHNEIDGIVALLRYKYLGIKNEHLSMLLEYKIHMNFDIRTGNVYHDYGFPGYVCHLVYVNKFVSKDEFNQVDEFYKILKSCGFDQTSVKALIDIAYEQKIDDVTLGEFLSLLSLDVIENRFLKVPQELKPFLNILNIIIDYYKNYVKMEIETHKKC